MTSYLASTYFDCCGFMVAHDKFVKVFDGAPAKSDAPEPFSCKSGCRLENCDATARLLLYVSVLYDVLNFNDVISTTNVKQ